MGLLEDTERGSGWMIGGNPSGWRSPLAVNTNVVAMGFVFRAFCAVDIDSKWGFALFRVVILLFFNAQ